MWNFMWFFFIDANPAPFSPSVYKKFCGKVLCLLNIEINLLLTTVKNDNNNNCFGTFREITQYVKKNCNVRVEAPLKSPDPFVLFSVNLHRIVETFQLKRVL